MSQSITGIPAEEVGNVVQDFVDDGATEIAVQRDENGTFTVSRTD